MFVKAWQWLKEALFPVHCVACGYEGEWWCTICRMKDTSPRVGSFCPICRASVAQTCTHCREASSLDSMAAMYAYHPENQIGQLIRCFKYQHAASLTELWRELITLTREAYGEPVVIPVPLFAARERDRDYNQATLLAQIIAQKYGFIIDQNNLKRIKNTKQQAKLGREERQSNMAGAFAWKGGVPPKEVLLVDDVFTTGATMQACALILKKQGVQVVHGFTIASGV